MKKDNDMKLSNVDIVIAHYNEDLEWIKPYAENVIIYHKGNETSPRFPVKKWIKINNVGRESHTYLYHIINNYNNLSDYTLFFQGGTEDHKKVGDMYDAIEDYIIEVQKYGFSCASLVYMIKRNPQIRHGGKWLQMYKNGSMQKAKDSFSVFYQKLLGTKQKLLTPFFYAANFGVSKELIHKRKPAFYENAICLLPEHSNPEEGHYFERLWFRIFNYQGGFSVHYFIKFLKKLFIVKVYNIFLKK